MVSCRDRLLRALRQQSSVETQVSRNCLARCPDGPTTQKAARPREPMRRALVSFEPGRAKLCRVSHHEHGSDQSPSTPVLASAGRQPLFADHKLALPLSARLLTKLSNVQLTKVLVFQIKATVQAAVQEGGHSHCFRTLLKSFHAAHLYSVS